MSASRRHGSAEDNILARLERDGKRGAAGKSWRHMNTTIAWCGLASLAVIGLVAVLASLAKENADVHDKPLVVEARPPSDSYAEADRKSGFAPLPALASAPKKVAVTGDDTVIRAMPRTAPVSAPPPLVMLKSTAARHAKPAAAPGKPAAVRSASSRPAAKSGSPKTTPVKVAAAPPPRAAAAPARPKKIIAPAVAAKPEPTARDSDVALLSAIIVHASRHSAERAQMQAQALSCPSGKKCVAPKATD